LIHALRRNIGLKILLFNNKVYGLTKGQFSPTSDLGQITKSSPAGVVSRPFSPPLLALGSEATFVARSIDTEVAHLQEMIRRMTQHRGTSFLEIYQNCPVFYDGAFGDLKDRKAKAEHLVFLEHGKPLTYGADAERVMKLDPSSMKLYTGTAGENDGGIEVRHDEKAEDATMATLLARHPEPGHPVPLGVFLDLEKPTFEERTWAQGLEAISNHGAGTLEELLDAGDRWQV
jgi:2-oxoglutarate ferredoxin oxidoreductase subunit beta